jgi:Lon protease-like protein
MKVPLFPLNLVLFPGQNLPLHIFEERYKAMLKKCLAEQSPFGIALIRDSGRAFRGSPHNTGTVARVLLVD